MKKFTKFHLIEKAKDSDWHCASLLDKGVGIRQCWVVKAAATLQGHIPAMIMASDLQRHITAV